MTQKIVCFYGVATDLGGAERSLLELVKGMKGEWKPWVLLPKSNGPLIDELKKEKISYTVLHFPSNFLKVSRKSKKSAFNLFFSIPGLILYFIKLILLIKKFNPVLIHTTGLKCHLIAPWVGAVLGIPVLIHIRDIFENGFSLKSLRLLMNHFNVTVVANSTASALPFSELNTKIDVVYNGISPVDFFPLKNDRYKKRFSIPDEVPVVGIVGAFARWKGQVEFIQAAALLVSRGVNARFVIVGGEIYDTHGETHLTDELKAEVKKLNINDHVLFTGFEKDTPKIMNGIDILVHASIQPEPFGRVIIEGMACGASLVVSRWGAAPEFFTHLENGMVVNPRNPEEIADAVEWLINHPFERSQMIDRSRKVFLDRFSHESYIASMEKQFEKTLNITQVITQKITNE